MLVMGRNPNGKLRFTVGIVMKTAQRERCSAIAHACAVVLVSAGLLMPALGQTTAQDASNIWNNFCATFSVSGGHFAWQQGGSYDKNDFWENAEMIEMATDCYIAAPTTQNENTLTALLNGFDTSNGKDWTGDKYNDDIMWAVLAHARAYLAIYNETRTVNSSMANWAINASNNFCWVYNGGHSPNRTQPQYDATLGGGMWWTNNSNPSTGTKNACVNGPGALAGFYLGLVYTNAEFTAMASNMISWESSKLITGNGELFDHCTASGVASGDYSYNAGTYVGAAGFLGAGVSAEKVAAYFTNFYDSNGILPNYNTGGGNNDGFNGIFLRWVGTYEILSGNTNWYGFFDKQAEAAWAVTNASGLSWDNWTTQTTAGGLYSWDCSPSVVALQWAQISQNPSAPLAPLQETLTMTATNGQLQLNWLYGTLESATNLSGPYQSVPNAISPYSAPVTSGQQFYRVREN